ncbi:protein FAR1-RELATED SEQUENCE 11-like [Rutidosis leptorrhynchoides]|uniref:protein FAR1-RELATED SEQUENCE 11-like n=1 Tax=Rutidosis leptorrhynchoides TaxID=125765 RepID=UPI003A9A10C8
MRRAPQTILTDQDQWMTNAIAKEMPLAKHAFCIRHITTKFSSWFMSVLRSEYSSWCSEFYTLYKLDTVEEFEKHWPLIIEKYNLSNNKHVVGLYKIKSFWVPAYLRDFFFGGMTTTGRSEIEDVQQKQIHDTMLQIYRGSYLRSLSPLEEQGYRFLTPFYFKKFQEQFGLAMQYSVEGIQYSSHEEKTVNFIVKHQTATKLHNVIWDVPSNYWHPRWGRKDTQADEICSSTQEVIVVDSNATFNDEAIVDAIDLVQCPIKSKTKGRPKQKRMKSEKELVKQRRCGFCRGFGHNINTCKERQVDDLND